MAFHFHTSGRSEGYMALWAFYRKLNPNIELRYYPDFEPRKIGYLGLGQLKVQIVYCSFVVVKESEKQKIENVLAESPVLLIDDIGWQPHNQDAQILRIGCSLEIAHRLAYVSDSMTITHGLDVTNFALTPADCQRFMAAVATGFRFYSDGLTPHKLTVSYMEEDSVGDFDSYKQALDHIDLKELSGSECLASRFDKLAHFATDN